MKTGNNYTRRVVMAFTSCVDHTVSIQTLIAAFLARKAIFSLVYKFKHSSGTTALDRILHTSVRAWLCKTKRACTQPAFSRRI